LEGAISDLIIIADYMICEVEEFRFHESRNEHHYLKAVISGLMQAMAMHL
jgi:hypothetical protein